MMDGFQYELQLVGGPDDGATFHSMNLPPYWEMLKAKDMMACVLLDVDDSIIADRYWRTDKVTEAGIVLYYHESIQNTGVLA